jgi:Flp pilus assembly protein TadD
VPPKAEIAPAGSEAAKSSSDIKETTPKKIVAPVMPAAAGDISESDISAPQASNQSTTRSTSSTAASATQSKECKEALAERDRAAEASDNSDKLFHLRRALRLCPQSAPLHHELGKVYGSMQRTKDAEDEFKQALSIDPSFSAAKRELGALLKDEIQF